MLENVFLRTYDCLSLGGSATIVIIMLLQGVCPFGGLLYRYF